MGAQVHLESPGRAVLVRDVKIGVGHLGRHQQTVVFQALFLAQRLETLSAHHLAQGVGRVHRAVDDDVRHMDALARELCVERLAQHSPTTHGCSVRVLAGVSAHRGRGRRDQQHPLAALLHVRKHHLRQAEEAEGGHAPADLECLQGGAGQAAVADLRTQVEQRHADRADLGLDVGDQLLDAALFDRIEHEAGGRTAFGLDLGHQPVQPGLVAAPGQASVVALTGKALGDIAADAGASADDQADGFAHDGFLQELSCHSEPFSPKLKHGPTN